MPNEGPVVVIGTSTGGLAALKEMLGAMPEGFGAPIAVTMHIGDRSLLPELLSSASPLSAKFAREGDPLIPGAVLIAPPGSHLLIGEGVVHLGHGAKENYCRPAIDPMFRSAAFSYRERVIAVLLTGELDDGTVGAQAVKSCGGVVVVQDPIEAESPSMPRSALDYVEVDHCLTLGDIAHQLSELIHKSSARPKKGASRELAIECDLDLHPAHATTETMDKFSARAPLVCPECQGVLWETNDAPLRYRCHTGHSFTAQTFAQKQNKSIEEALWVAIRAIRDKEVFFKRQQQTATSRNMVDEAKEYGIAAEHARDAAEKLVDLTTHLF
jgi:two-component system chemotaxis response regulator CheB